MLLFTYRSQPATLSQPSSATTANNAQELMFGITRHLRLLRQVIQSFRDDETGTLDDDTRDDVEAAAAEYLDAIIDAGTVVSDILSLDAEHQDAYTLPLTFPADSLEGRLQALGLANPTPERIAALRDFLRDGNTR